MDLFSDASIVISFLQILFVFQILTIDHMQESGGSNVTEARLKWFSRGDRGAGTIDVTGEYAWGPFVLNLSVRANHTSRVTYGRRIF